MSEGNVGEYWYYHHWISIIDTVYCSPRDSFTVIDTMERVREG